MSKRCARCPRWVKPTETFCEKCKLAVTTDLTLNVACTWQAEGVARAKAAGENELENSWQDVPEPTSKREYSMSDEHQGVEAGQTWEVTKTWAYWDVGQHLFVVSRWPKITNTIVVDDKRELRRVSQQLLLKSCRLIVDQYDHKAHERCVQCNEPLLAFHLDPHPTVCKSCQEEQAEPRPEPVTLKCIICGKDFEGPPAACGPCYGQLKVRADDALAGAAGTLTKLRHAQGNEHFLRLARAELRNTVDTYAAAFAKLGFTATPNSNEALEKALAEFVSCFPGYRIGMDKGAGPDKTVCQVVKVPEKVETAVQTDPSGVGIQMMRFGCFTKRVTADKAVWDKGD